MSEEYPGLWQFGEFRLDVRRKMLRYGDTPVSMPLKELEVLSMLVRNRGELVTKDELLTEIWADSFVEESNLTRHIYLLRKTLKDLGADGLIENVPRRGYRFTGEARVVESDEIVLERHTQTRTLIEFEDDPKAKRPLLGTRMAVSLSLGALLLVSAFGSLGYWYTRPGSSGGPIRSIAVVPFRTIGSDGSREYSGAGLADILTTRLSSIKELQLRSTASLNSPPEDIAAVAQRLDVDAVVDGTIYHAGDRIRVTARLVRRDGSIVWSGSFDKIAREELLLQHDLASQIVPALALTLSNSERDAITKRYTESADAYDLYLRGRYEWNKRSTPGMIEAQRLFRNALAADPGFALAHVGLADTILMNQPFQDESLATIKRALELDPNLAEAHASWGFYLMFYDWNWEQSEAAFKRSIELNPNYATAHHWYSTLLAIRGDLDGAKIELEKALKINPNSHNFLADFGQLYYFSGDYEQAEAYCLKALELYPDFVFAHEYLHYIYIKTGRYEEAVTAIAKADEINGSLGAEGHAIPGDVVSKHREIYRDRGFEGYMEYRYSSAPRESSQYYLYAMRYAVKGEKDTALDYLDRSVKAGMFLSAFARANPLFDSLRSEPRYQEILRRMRLG
jgi:DNA-binding winged helix-turn-helix (wHTH) protein/TolB-like protein/Tfp pilus assembly protein PilF